VLLERLPLQQLHYDETLPFVYIMNRADAGMIESGGRLCLPLETGQSLGVSRNFRRKEDTSTMVERLISMDCSTVT